MRNVSGRALAVGVAGLVAAGSLVLGAPTAQAATTAHCTTAVSGPGLSTPMLTSRFIAQLSNCGGSFTDQGAPYTIALDSVVVFYMNGLGMLTSYTFHNLVATCTTASATSAALTASGCSYAA
jgi:hypothetical protein